MTDPQLAAGRVAAARYLRIVADKPDDWNQRGDQMAIFHINDLPPVPPPTEQTDADRVMPGEGDFSLKAFDFVRGHCFADIFNTVAPSNEFSGFSTSSVECCRHKVA